MKNIYISAPKYLKLSSLPCKKYVLEDNHDLINKFIEEKVKRILNFAKETCPYNTLIVNDEIIMFAFKLKNGNVYTTVDIIINRKTNIIEVVSYYNNNYLNVSGEFDVYRLENAEMSLLENYYMPLIEAMDLIS
jgi:hypothetical protein